MSGAYADMEKVLTTAGSRSATAPITRSTGSQSQRRCRQCQAMAAWRVYSNAGELFDVIYETMPWWNPGSVSDEGAWELTAYLMRARGEIHPDTSLDAGNAPIYRLHTPAPEVADESPGVAALLITLTIGTIAFVWKKG